MKRRQFCAGMVVTGFGTMMRPETFVFRKARFEELGEWVLMTSSFPELLRKRDREAMASIDSGFTTTLAYTVSVVEYGSNRLVHSLRRTVDLRYHLYFKKYEIVVRHGATVSPPRYVEKRDAAVEIGLAMNRVRIVRAAQLERAPRRGYYYVTVVGQRNPTDPVGGNLSLDPEAGRAQGRDVRWFSRFLDFLAGDLPRAEETVLVHTQPFYLVSR